MSKKGMWTAKELLLPVSGAGLGGMLWWAFYFVSVVEVVLFCFNATAALIFDRPLLWHREFLVLGICVTVVISYRLTARKKKEPIQLPETTRGK